MRDESYEVSCGMSSARQGSLRVRLFRKPKWVGHDRLKSKRAGDSTVARANAS